MRLEFCIRKLELNITYEIRIPVSNTAIYKVCFKDVGCSGTWARYSVFPG
jgi:hypothetical protein